MAGRANKQRKRRGKGCPALSILLLLIAPLAMAAQDWPVAEGASFQNDTGAPLPVVMCEKNGSGCGPVMTIAPGPGWINCGYFNFGTSKPPEGTYPRICNKAAPASPTAGPVVLANLGEFFPIPAKTAVKMLRPDGSLTEATLFWSAETSALCTAGLFFPREEQAFTFVPTGRDAGKPSFQAVKVIEAPAGSKCVAAPWPQPPAVAAEMCWSTNLLDYYKPEPLAPGDSSYYTQALAWKSDCGEVISVQLFNDDEKDGLLRWAGGAALTLSLNRDSLNAYAKTQPVRDWTDSERAAVTRIRAKYMPAAPPPPPPAPVFNVAKNGTQVTRPVYASANGARKRTTSGALAAKIGDVKIGLRCNATLTVEDKYMGVEGLVDYVTGKPLPAGAVALCEPN